MTRNSTVRTATSPSGVGRAFDEMTASFERFCLAAGLDALGAMMEADAVSLCGARHGRDGERRGHRWGRTAGPIGFHGGKVAVARPRVRERGGREVPLPSWEAAVREDWLGRWAMNLMLIGVSTRRFGRAVRLPEGDVPAGAGAGVSKSAASRRFVALSAERMAEWVAKDLSQLDLLVVQIDGIHVAEDVVLLAAIGIDGEGVKHPLGLLEGATENAAVVQALLDDLVGRGLDPAACRLFIVDGSKALTKAIRRTFGRDTPIQRCQIHKARNITERLPKDLHASVRRTLRQAWELDDAAKAERLIRNLARTLEHRAPGVSGAILEGLDEILTVVRLQLPKELRRSLACTNIIENVMGSVRRVCRNVKRWRSTGMALRWTAAAMLEAAKGFRKLKAKSQLPLLRAALAAHRAKTITDGAVAQETRAA
ncbi:MAG: IS256 family transposase [Acidobacteria bacterium]|nr:IS256 family transposase [Acidobacteriota bacterium]